jgi:hypothetical protein
MFRHMVRQSIKFGGLSRFVAALKEVNALAASVGVPNCRAWSSTFGGLNEVWTEADYESLDAHVAAWEKARSDDAFMMAFREMVSHITFWSGLGAQVDRPVI